MTTRQRNRAMTSMVASSLGVAATAAALGFGVLSTAGQALAEPVIPTPTPGAPVPPGTPVVEQNVAGGDAPPAPPPVGAPMVPEVAAQDAHYGSGNGPLGSLRDAWHQAKDPFNTAEEPDGQVPGGSAPPPGAGPAPALPPGYVSINAPGSETAAAPKDPTQGPALPPGYYPLNGPPPPPDYYANGGPAAAAAPANPNAPKPYVPVVSPPPPPLILPQQ